MSSSTQRIRAHVAACMLLGAGMIGDAHGAIVYSGAVSIPIPDTIDGVYLNLVTGATGSTGSTVPGYDLNPYTSGASGSLHLFANAMPPTNGYLSLGGTNLGPYRLPAGTPIGAPGATFFRPVADYNVAPELNLNSSDNLIGVSFLNEGLGEVNFGWVRVQVGASTATRSIVGYAYETAGTPIDAGQTVGNTPPTITATPIAAFEGNGSVIRSIGTVGDAEDATPPTVTVDGGASSTANGITIDTLVVDPLTEELTANVEATCGATAASFALRATDSGGAFSDATLNVTIAANIPPALEYPPVGVASGGSIVVPPSLGPSDSGPITSIVLQSAGTYTGSISVDNTSGVVDLGNAQPPGDHTLQIRVTDVCGLTDDATLAVAVSDAADLAIAKSVNVSGLADGVLVYSIVVTNAGPSTASGATVTDLFASPQSGVTWTCSSMGGGSCSAAGSGDIADVVTLGAGGTLTYTAVVDVPVPLAASFDNTATVEAPVGLVDPDASNNSATVTVLRLDVFADGFESPPP